jgi:hypothetical protein
VQAPTHQPALTSLLHAIDKVFDSRKHSTRRQAVSTSKLENGDASFSTHKRILGWDVDTYHMQPSLPKHCLDTITALLQTYLQQWHTSMRKWAKLIGVLQSSAPALYGAHHLFSILQHAAKHQRRRPIRITPLLRMVLQDWQLLVNDIHTTPAPLHTVVPTAPTLLATTDASHLGMGGTWTSVIEGTPRHYLWRTPLSSPLQKQLITADNPGGSITINDLELSAILIGPG